MKLQRLYTVVITPFKPNGKLDQEGLRCNLRTQIKEGIKGIVVLGTTGEAPTLSTDEKRTIIQIACEEVKGKASLWVGTGCYSTEQTIANTREAQELGADGALVISPYYNKPTQEGLFRHFAEICHSVDLPICIYNHQGRTGQNLETSTLERLLEFPSIIGVKEASGNMMQITDVIDIVGRTRPLIRVLSGDDALTLPLMAMGGYGVFSVASNLVPGPVNQMVQAAAKGDFDLARSWHYQLLPLFKASFIETNPIPIKTAMRLCGMPAGGCRLPLCDLTSASEHKIKQVINSLSPSWLGEYGLAKSACC